MWLKFLIFAVVAVVIYKFLGGSFPSLGKSKEEKKLEDDTLVECEKCGTYVTVKESLLVSGKYYCCDACTS